MVSANITNSIATSTIERLARRVDRLGLPNTRRVSGDRSKLFRDTRPVWDSLWDSLYAYLTLSAGFGQSCKCLKLKKL